jgi:adenosylcobinamide-phosphate synthase
MAAMALRLGVRLRKPGVYALNAQGRAPQAADVARALRLAGRAVATVGVSLGVLAALLR